MAIVSTLFLIPVVNAAPLEDFGYRVGAYTMYDARYHTDDSTTEKTGGWHLVLEMDDVPGAFESIKRVKFVNQKNRLTIWARPETFDRYVWMGRPILGLDIWLGHELNAEGVWKVVLFGMSGQKYTTKLFLTQNELNLPKPPIVEVLHMQPADGGTLVTFKAPFPQNWDGGAQVRFRIFGDVDGDGKVDDAVQDYRNGCPGDTDYDPAQNFCFDPSNDTVTFFVPYSETLGRIEYRYLNTPIGTNRTVRYLNLP